MILTAADREWIVEQAEVAGFDLAGIAAVPTPAEDAEFSAWIAAGYAGELDYLTRVDGDGKLLRGDVRRSTPWARSVIVCAFNYDTAIDGQRAPLSIEPAPKDSGWIARYTWSARDAVAGKADEGERRPADYHDILKPRLEQVEMRLRQRYGDACKTRCYVDTGPILERDFAARAGIGWIGRNTCVINEQQGSWLLLGVIVTSLELPTEVASLGTADRCGSCTRCIDACPTDALLPAAAGRRSMDATRCIAYLTIEKKGSIAEELRAPMGRQVFGCDICQDVCPWNAKAQRGVVSTTPSGMQMRPELVNPSLAWLAGLEGPEFTRVFRGSPVERDRRQTSRRKFFRRNVAIAMGNSGDMSFVPQLEAWAATDEPVLAEAAGWALKRLRETVGNAKTSREDK